MEETYKDHVFINCPFDTEYSLNLQAIVFTVYGCGFYPVSALSEDNALVNRLSKIENLIEGCQYGIHDISRTELNLQGFPRFNMPFELGIFFGAKRFGNKVQKSKNALIFERTSFTYQNYFSDLSGIDTKAHNDNRPIIIKSIRDWFVTSSKRTTIPGHLSIIDGFNNFQTALPAILVNVGLELSMLTFNDLCLIIEEFLKQIITI
ncbi:MAG: hypothetical protein JWQ09_4966 [Segetibacter sp.]|nr:hypothetical protein [Segetibacter sp.]